MARQIVLDIETTGLEHSEGHRIIEVAALELVDRRLTGEQFHRYFNPEREVDLGAREVHGISYDQLLSEKKFHEYADDLLEFLGEAELIIHNAPFDLGFLDMELERCRRPGLTERHPVLDTLELARRRHPGQRNALDALCARYQVDASQRTLHGALLDAELLAEVYLAMTGGQMNMELAALHPAGGATAARGGEDGPRTAPWPELRVVNATEDELRRHEAKLEELERASGAPPVWRQWEEQHSGG